MLGQKGATVRAVKSNTEEILLDKILSLGQNDVDANFDLVNAKN